MTPDELTDKITSSSVIPETNIVEITVTDSTPDSAQRLSQGVASALTASVSELETTGSSGPNGTFKATIVDPASLPETPVSPRPFLNLSVAGFLGLLLGFGVTVLTGGGGPRQTPKGPLPA